MSSLVWFPFLRAGVCHIALHTITTTIIVSRYRWYRDAGDAMFVWCVSMATLFFWKECRVKRMRKFEISNKWNSRNRYSWFSFRLQRFFERSHFALLLVDFRNCTFFWVTQARKHKTSWGMYLFWHRHPRDHLSQLCEVVYLTFFTVENVVGKMEKDFKCRLTESECKEKKFPMCAWWVLKYRNVLYLLHLLFASLQSWKGLFISPLKLQYHLSKIANGVWEKGNGDWTALSLVVCALDDRVTMTGVRGWKKLVLLFQERTPTAH